ncbi:MAG: choice-of-anchor D domain-containing protein [bacterium]
MKSHRWFCGSLILGAILLSAFGIASAQGFNAVYAKDGSDVWAVGDAGAVWRSLDGGAIWGSYPLGTANHRAVASQGLTVLIVGDGGSLYRSVNSGNSFSAQTTLAGGANLRCLAFVDASTAWAVGDAGTILKSVDGGQNWVTQTSGTAANLYGVRFADANEGWACGAAGTVVHTVDGGANWVASTPFSVARTLQDIDFLGATVYVGGGDAFFASSTNSGGAWTEGNLRIESRSTVDGLEVLPSGRIVLSGGGGFIRISTNAGANWTFAQHNIVTGFSDLHFIDSSNGWACSARSNNIAKTTNGGTSWTVVGGASWSYTWSLKQSTGSTVRGMTFDIDPVNRDVIYGAMGRTIYKSTNRGDTWANVATVAGSTSNYANSFYVSRSNNQVWVAAMQSTDRITKTTDAGLTWTTTLSSQFTEYGMPLERDINNPEVLYFGGEDGQLRKSTDFGSTWTIVSDPNFRSPCDLVVVQDAPNVIWVGDGVTGSGNGQMFRSTDGGVTFALEYTTTGSEVPTISSTSLNPNIGFSTHWGSGGVRRTFDQGDNWSQIATTGSAWGTDVAKDDPTVPAYGVYSGQLSYVSTDLGGTFKTCPTNGLPGSNYAIMIYDRGTFFAMQSGGIYKANITQAGIAPNNAQMLALSVPNGGEVWQYNEVRNITWSSQNVATVNIEYSVDGGAWQPIATDAAGPAGSFPWLVPAVASSNVRVRVTDGGDAAPIDESAAPFSIIVPLIATAEPLLEFGTVNIGDTSWLTLHITNSGNAPLVISNVSAGGGEPGDALANATSKAPVIFDPNRTSFSIPAGLTDTLVVAFSPQEEIAYTQDMTIESNAPGSPTIVPLAGTGYDPGVLRVFAPNGGESWQYNTAHNITWQPGTAANVNLEYETSPGGGWVSIASNVPATPASYAWTLPGSATTTAKVRITDAANALVLDLSNGPFEITAQALSVAPDDIDFGALPAFQTTSQVVTVSNPGTALLTVTNVASDLPEFVPSRTNFTVAVAASETLTVFFTPSAEQTFTATLTVTSDAPVALETVGLTGQGSSVTDVAGGLPHRFELRDAVPNPFSANGTSITYGLPKACNVSLVVYNASGQEVARLVDGTQSAGYYNVSFAGAGSSRATGAALTSGVYLYRLTAGEFVETRRMVLVR